MISSIRPLAQSFRRHPATTLLFLLVCAGCQGTTRITPDPRVDVDVRAALRRSVPIFDRQGAKVAWRDVLTAADSADVIFMGERHDDEIGHAVQLAFFEDAASRWPDTMLSMEMLDRRRQPAADDYVDGMIDREQFLHDIATTKFRTLARAFLDRKIDRAAFEKGVFKVGWPDWDRNYQPIIDVAREHKLHVVAANTPWRRYASLANHDGFERLATLTAAQRRLVEIPQLLPDGAYRRRFDEVMTPASHDASEAATSAPTHEFARRLDGAYRAQCVMDATMADSIADALADQSGRVVHLVGQFHCDFNGGIVQQLLHLRPATRVMTISLQCVDTDTWLEHDRDRADFVIYTGRAIDQVDVND